MLQDIAILTGGKVISEEIGFKLDNVTPSDLGVIADMAQSVAVMYAGKIVEYVDVVRLFDNPMHPYTVGLMESIPKMDEVVPEDKILRTIPGVVPSLYDLPSGCYFQERCNEAFDACIKKVPPLIEIEPGHLLRCWKYEQQ